LHTLAGLRAGFGGLNERKQNVVIH
jgi:hypothetical protein